ncbi:MAG TPA: sigma-70 family RNA polymerase sigma factor [Saprospiraceae bacterium]|nr:sigma-70 family RNA polymerase sigma factor [Saprospiraceae bacterium]
MATLPHTPEESEMTRKDRIFQREFYPLMDAVHGYAYRLTNDREAAEDLVQETYLKVWHFMHRYTEDTFAKAWLFRICRNAFINDYRTRKNMPYKQDFEDIVVYHNEDDPVAPRYFGLQEEMNNSLMGDEMTRALQALRPDFRTVVLLDLEDFTYEEIAAILDIPIGTVRSRLHRARNVLARKLRDYAQASGYCVSDDEPAQQKNQSGDDTNPQPMPAAA